MPELSKELQESRSKAVSEGAYVLTAAQYERMKQGDIINFPSFEDDDGVDGAVLLAGIDLERKLTTADFNKSGKTCFQESNQRPGVATETIRFDVTPDELDTIMEVLGFAMQRREEQSMAAGALLAIICRSWQQILMKVDL